MSYDKLFYDSVIFTDVREEFGPRFICPKCKHRWQTKVKLTVPPTTASIEDNQRRMFRCPSCGIKINLYVAVKLIDGKSYIEISKVPILREDWWKMEPPPTVKPVSGGSSD